MKTPDQEATTRPECWRRVASEPQHEYRMFRTRRDRSISPSDGSEHDFDVMESPDAVTVVALTSDGEFVLVEQFRHGTRQVVTEFPGGVVDKGESALECGPRELLEETGYAGSEPEFLGTVSLNASFQQASIHIVRVLDARPVAEKELDESEDTRVRLATPEELMAMVVDGSFDTAVALAALGLHQWKNAGASG